MVNNEELTHDEILALADAFPPSKSGRTLLALAHFPRAAIPESGFSNSRDFWTLIAEQVADGVKEGIRREILVTASGLLPANLKFRAFAAGIGQAPSASQKPGSAGAPKPAGPPGTVTVTRSAGNQLGDNGLQVNIFTGAQPHAIADTAVDRQSPDQAGGQTPGAP
jgi:hypothetical protein